MLSIEERVKLLEEKVSLLTQLLTEHHHGHNDRDGWVEGDQPAVIIESYIGNDRRSACSVESLQFKIKEFKNNIIDTFEN